MEFGRRKAQMANAVSGYRKGAMGTSMPSGDGRYKIVI